MCPVPARVPAVRSTCEGLARFILAREAVPRRPPGFFPCYRAAFRAVNECERLASLANGDECHFLPDFGASDAAWPAVAKFYAAAANFRSCRTFREAEPRAESSM